MRNATSCARVYDDRRLFTPHANLHGDKSSCDFQPPLAFTELLSFRNGVRYLRSFQIWYTPIIGLCSPQIWFSSIHVPFRTPMCRYFHPPPPPLKPTGKIINNAAARWPIMFKFVTLMHYNPAVAGRKSLKIYFRSHPKGPKVGLECKLSVVFDFDPTCISAAIDSNGSKTCEI